MPCPWDAKQFIKLIDRVVLAAVAPPEGSRWGSSHHALNVYRAQLPAFRADEARSGQAVPDRHPVLRGVLVPTRTALLSVLDRLAVLADKDCTLNRRRPPRLRLA